MTVVNNIFDKTFAVIEVGELKIPIKKIPAKASLNYLSSNKLQEEIKKTTTVKLIPEEKFKKMSDQEKKDYLLSKEKEQELREAKYLDMLEKNYDEVLKIILPVVKKNINESADIDWIDENLKINPILELFTLVVQNIGFSNENPDVKKKE